MGQVESQSSVDPPAATPDNSSQPPSMESLIAEAAAFGNEDDTASLEEKAQKALDCPCIADLRKGVCGTQFSGAFLCFLKSTAEEKGSDCVSPFVALQSCILANPGAFSEDVLKDSDEVEKDKEKKLTQEPEIKIRPPSWSIERKPKVEQAPMPKL